MVAIASLHIKKIGVDLEGGFEAEFPDAPPEIWTNVRKPLDFPELLRLCDAALAAAGKRCWLLVDRLDAAFQADPELEKLALRSLIVAYKDLMGRERIRPKLFFRTDLFDLVAGSGFRELTHVQDRTSPPIAWDADKLLHMIIERFVFNEAIRKEFHVTRDDVQDPETREALFYYLFPNQVDVGPRKPDTWSWMQSRIRDGNSIRTPRDLHGLVKNSAIKEREFLAIGQGLDSETLIGAAALREGLAQLSTDKVKTTLIAENPDLEAAITAFKGQKAEQNGETLIRLLGASWETIVDRLARIGFLEKTGSSWKVPLLYRDGLDIVQGAAFPKKPSKEDEE